MPVEIKELVVRAVVRAPSTGADGSDTTTSGATTLGEAERETLLRLCVQEVLKVLRKSKER